MGVKVKIEGNCSEAPNCSLLRQYPLVCQIHERQYFGRGSDEKTARNQARSKATHPQKLVFDNYRRFNLRCKKAEFTWTLLSSTQPTADKN